MPVSPDLVADAAKATLQAYLDAELEVLRVVARRLAQGIGQPGWAETKLVELQAVRQDLEALVAELAAGDPDRIRDAIQRAFNRGTATAATDLAGLGASIDLAFTSSNLATVTALADETVGRVARTHAAILRQALDAYRDVIAQTAQLVTTGATTRREAAGRALDRWAARGIVGFEDAAGRRWDLASYAEMAVRTATSRAVLAGHTERLLGYGIDLVIVSDSPQECELCRPWERKVLAIGPRRLRRTDDGVPVAGTLSGAMAAGLFHPNCTHSTAAYTPGLTRVGLPGGRPTANPEGDAARQHLRYLERGLRRWRRRAAVAMTAEERRRAEAHVRAWQGRIRDHVATTEAKRQPARERLGAR